MRKTNQRADLISNKYILVQKGKKELLLNYKVDFYAGQGKEE